MAALEKSLGDDIKTLPWMTDATKKAAEEKLAMIRNKIGYPEKWRDYTALKVSRDDLIGNLNRNAVFQRDWNLDHLGKPVDESADAWRHAWRPTLRVAFDALAGQARADAREESGGIFRKTSPSR